MAWHCIAIGQRRVGGSDKQFQRQRLVFVGSDRLIIGERQVQDCDGEERAGTERRCIIIGRNHGD